MEKEGKGKQESTIEQVDQRRKRKIGKHNRTGGSTTSTRLLCS